jgi:1-acyl-sn-glycerol-3-phosphate acyltransferase
VSGFRYYTTIILQKIGYCLFFVLYKIFIKLEIAGKENLIGLSGPIILAPNHTGELDVTALPLALPFFSALNPIYFVMSTSKRFRTAPNFGWRQHIYGSYLLSLLGGVSINSGHEDYTVSLAEHVNLLKNKRTVCIFPEGKCTKTGEFGPARGGLGYLVYVSGATVVPIAIDTFFKMTWPEFLAGRRKVTIKIGRPMEAGDIIPPEAKNLTAEDFRSAAQIILNKSKEMMS